MRSEIRKAYFLDQYVIIAPGREKRPREMVEKTVVLPPDKCVFCPESLDKELLIKAYFVKKDCWALAVIKNKYPVVSQDNSRAYGVQEVIIDTPDHDRIFCDFDQQDVIRYFAVISSRLRAVSRDKKISYILQFKNEGSKAGATIKHSHSQLFATGIIPADIQQELSKVSTYKEKRGSCPYCDILKKELSSPRRIFEDEYVGAFAPYASSYHYEVWIFPKRHIDNVSRLNKSEVRSISKCLLKILKRVRDLKLGYNFFMHQSVFQRDQHFYIKIEPRDSNVWAGIELGSGLVVNSVPPEKAARYYRGS